MAGIKAMELLMLKSPGIEMHTSTSRMSVGNSRSTVNSSLIESRKTNRSSIGQRWVDLGSILHMNYGYNEVLKEAPEEQHKNSLFEFIELGVTNKLIKKYIEDWL